MGLNFDDALKGWKENDAPSKREKVNDEKISYIDSLMQSHKQMLSILTELKKETLHGKPGKEIDDIIRQYVAQSEVLFLSGKKLVNYQSMNILSVSGKEKLSVFGNWLDKRYQLKKNGDEYTLILPPMVSQYKLQRRLQEGKAIHLLVLYLIEKYQEDASLEIFPRAEITFKHFIDDKMPEISVPDPDNIDIKKVIDTLQGFIIESDNLLHINLHHESFLSDWAHTEIIIKRTANIPQKII